MSLTNFFRRKRIDTEAARREHLLRTGRIAEGMIFDIANDEAGAITQIFYQYNVNGADYESSQQLSDEQRAHQEDYAPGAHITVRYHPHQPSNSIVV
jgi:hypothetical protein